MNPSSSLPFPVNARTASDTQDDAEPPHGELVTVTRVFNSLEAEMLRGCLQAEGIPATLGDAQTIQKDTLLTVAMGGIRGMVPGPSPRRRAPPSTRSSAARWPSTSCRT